MNFDTHQLVGVGGTVTLGLTFLSGLSDSFGPVAEIFPPEVKKWVTLISAGATVILMAWHTATSKSTSATSVPPAAAAPIAPPLPTSILTK